MTSNRTIVLSGLLVLVILIQVFPQHSTPIKVSVGLLGVGYFGLWGGARIWRGMRAKSARARLAAADEAEFREYESALEAIRARYDPGGEGLGSPDASSELKAALTALHARHAAMLDRKFGAGGPPANPDGSN